MKYFYALALLMLSPIIGATEQIEEWLDLGGIRLAMEEFPLESHPNYQEIVKDIGSEVCSASWRGYQGIWSVANNKLYLSRLFRNPCDKTTEYYDPKDLTGLRKTGGIASWYTGNITFRISRKTYLTKESHGTRGAKYEVVEYKVNAGEVVSREIKHVQREW